MGVTGLNIAHHDTGRFWLEIGRNDGRYQLSDGLRIGDTRYWLLRALGRGVTGLYIAHHDTGRFWLEIGRDDGRYQLSDGLRIDDTGRYWLLRALCRGLEIMINIAWQNKKVL